MYVQVHSVQLELKQTKNELRETEGALVRMQRQAALLEKDAAHNLSKLHESLRELADARQV